ncbi:MAG: hypothetical protein DMD77_27770 [Candidatus Rokuibacteriota bacterium]|nr:MAG: hypothetical protein DMD77_27770 [Candidatus Rokubacteria bacterium]
MNRVFQCNRLSRAAETGGTVARSAPANTPCGAAPGRGRESQHDHREIGAIRLRPARGASRHPRIGHDHALRWLADAAGDDRRHARSRADAREHRRAERSRRRRHCADARGRGRAGDRGLGRGTRAPGRRVHRR